MQICPSCGVELAETAKICPLCRSSPVSSSGAVPFSEPPFSPGIPETDPFETLPPSDKQKIFLEIVFVCSLIASFVVFAVELIISRQLSWSLYPIIFIAYLCTVVCVPILMKRHPFFVFLIIALVTLFCVFLVAYVSGGLAWFFPVGMPIVLICEFAVIFCVLLTVYSRRQGVNIIAIILVGLSIVCVGIETVLDLYFAQRFLPDWSAVVATAGLSVSVFLFYLHYRFNNRASLKKLFHL